METPAQPGMLWVPPSTCWILHACALPSRKGNKHLQQGAHQGGRGKSALYNKDYRPSADGQSPTHTHTHKHGVNELGTGKTAGGDEQLKTAQKQGFQRSQESFQRKKVQLIHTTNLDGTGACTQPGIPPRSLVWHLHPPLLCGSRSPGRRHHALLEQGLNRLYYYKRDPTKQSQRSQVSPWRHQEVMIAEKVTGIVGHDPGIQET